MCVRACECWVSFPQTMLSNLHCLLNFVRNSNYISSCFSCISVTLKTFGLKLNTHTCRYDSPIEKYLCHVYSFSMNKYYMFKTGTIDFFFFLEKKPKTGETIFWVYSHLQTCSKCYHSSCIRTRYVSFESARENTILGKCERLPVDNQQGWEHARTTAREACAFFD